MVTKPGFFCCSVKLLTDLRFVAIIGFLVVFVCIWSFSGLRLSTAFSPPPSTADPGSVLLSMPAGNCSCRISYVNPPGASSWLCQPAKVPEYLCNCQPPKVHNSTSMREVTECPKCQVCPECQMCPAPPPEVQPVEKEVAACPLAAVQVVERLVEKEVARPCPNVPWYAQDKYWHFPPGFPMCSMDVCFNYTKCEDMEEPLVYSYDLPSPPLRYFNNLKESKYWTNDTEKACLFFVFIDTDSPWPTWPRDLPYWNGGMNHVIITWGDRWERKGPAADSLGNASVMASISYETTFRTGFDISIPLPKKADVEYLQSVNILERKYFMTFRGTRYIGGGEGSFRSDDSFRGMHNGKDVIVATTCNHQTNNIARKERPEIGVYCDEDDEIYRSYNFDDLMNTTFALCPGGRQPNSFRFIEVLSAGSIPVLVVDNYVKPFDSMIHWHDCLLQFPTSQMHRIVPTLRAMKEEDIVLRHENCLAIHNEFLRDDDTLQVTTMRALKERFLGVLPNFAQVQRRKSPNPGTSN